MPNAPAPANAYGQYGFEGSAEQRYPFDSQQNWVHGYFQEIPAYGGHHFFRPYNYKDVLSQSQTAGGWGERPMMPYSQQFWHKYHDQATMLKTTQAAPIGPKTPWGGHTHALPRAPWSGHLQPAYAGSTIVAPGHQLVVPSSGSLALPAPQHTPVQNYAAVQNYTPVQNYAASGLLEPQGPALQPAVNPINPAVYRR